MSLIYPSASHAIFDQASQFGKAAPALKSELLALKNAGLVQRGIERFQQSVEPNAIRTDVLQTTKPASSQSLPAKPSAGGWKSWFSLPFAPLVY